MQQVFPQPTYKILSLAKMVSQAAGQCLCTAQSAAAQLSSFMVSHVKWVCGIHFRGHNIFVMYCKDLEIFM